MGDLLAGGTTKMAVTTTDREATVPVDHIDTKSRGKLTKTNGHACSSRTLDFYFMIEAGVI